MQVNFKCALPNNCIWSEWLLTSIVSLQLMRNYLFWLALAHDFEKCTSYDFPTFVIVSASWFCNGKEFWSSSGKRKIVPSVSTSSEWLATFSLSLSLSQLRISFQLDALLHAHINNLVYIICLSFVLFMMFILLLYISRYAWILLKAMSCLLELVSCNYIQQQLHIYWITLLGMLKKKEWCALFQ